MMDGFGVQGMIFHFAIVFSLVGSAFLVFLYLWWNRKLDMDEEPKFNIFEGEKDA